MGERASGSSVLAKAIEQNQAKKTGITREVNYQLTAYAEPALPSFLSVKDELKETLDGSRYLYTMRSVRLL